MSSKLVWTIILRLYQLTLVGWFMFLYMHHRIEESIWILFLFTLFWGLD